MALNGALERVELHAADCGEVEAWAAEAGWELDYQQTGRGPYDARLKAVECGRVIATHEHHNVALGVWGTPADDTVCMFLRDAGEPVNFRGSRLGNREAGFLRAGDDALATFGTEGGAVHAITMTWDDISAAIAGWGYEPEDILLDRGILQVTPGERAALARAIRDAQDPMTELADHPADLEQELVDAFVDALVSAGRLAREEPRLASYGVYVKRAQAWIEAHLEDDLRVVELAEVAGTTARTLQSSFKAVLGVSPMRYVRVRRLDRLRRSLLRRDARQTVTSLALRHGINHMGRLSGDYRELFGELPRDTGYGSAYRSA